MGTFLSRDSGDCGAHDASRSSKGKAMKRVGVGIAGLGRMGQFHVESLAKAPSVELVRVVDAVEDVARAVGERLGVEWSTSYDDLLSDSVIDGVVLATPTAQHAPMIEAAAAAGKHVFSEKPISLDLAASQRAVKSARAHGVKLQVGFHRRFDPDWAEATRRIRDGELGDVYLFRTSLRDMRPPSVDFVAGSGGFFVDVTIHDLDTARWMVGEIDEVSAVGTSVSDPAFGEIGDFDNALVVLRFAGGALGVIDNSRVAGYGYECSTEVVGANATVRVDGHRVRQLQWLTPGQASVDWVRDFTERYPEAYLLELEHFAQAIRDDGPVAVSGEDAIAAFLLAQACARSAAEGRSIRMRHQEREGSISYSPAAA